MTTRTENRPSHEDDVQFQKSDAIEDGDAYKPTPVGSFVRGDSRPSNGGGFTSRLSTAIRRSLRLKSRTSGNRTSTEPPMVGINKVDDLTKTARKGETFTEFADVAKQPCERQWVAMEEIENIIRINRHGQLKKIVRNSNWPTSHEIRSQLWKLLSMDKNFGTNTIIYLKELEDMLKSGVKTLSPSFISAEGTVIHDYGLKEQGAVTLQRLLIVIECGRPALKVVPVLYPLCALLLHYMSPEDSYAAVIRMLDSGQKQRFLLQTELASMASSRTLLSLLKKHKKSVYTLLKRRVNVNDETLAKIFNNWQAWIFKKLPFEYVVRVVDCFLVEGHKLLLRVTLALTYVWYKAKGKEVVSSRREFEGMSVEERIAEVERQIADTAENCPISVQTLLDVGCSIRNLKQSTIDRLQKEHESDLQEYVTKLQNERPAHRSQHLYSVAFSSKILDTDAASEIMASLPDRLQLEMPLLLYRLSEHGASFTKMWSLVDEAEQTLIIIRSIKGDVFGAYCSSCWAERRDRHERSRSRFFGTGESFVWLLNRQCGLPVTYGWRGRNGGDQDAPQMFQAATEKSLIIGSGGGDAIHITGELTNGISYPCDTYDSPALVENNGKMLWAQKQLQDAIQFVFPGKCFDKMVIELNPIDPQCLPLVISRFLGLAITAGSLLLFVPQILKIYASKSGTGISLSSQLLGLLACAGTAAYSFESGFVFSQWGDSFFVAVQTVIIIMQILYYSDASAYAFAFLAFSWAASFAVIGHHIPIEVLTLIQASTIPIVMVAKGIQIIENFRNSSTGQLSLISVLLQFGGCVARVFTSLQETGDNLIIINFAIATFLNGIILSQVLYYWSKEPRARPKHLMAFFRRTGSKLAEYCKNVANDYATVARETVQTSKERPIRTAIVLSGVGGLGYAFTTNPTEEDMENLLAEKRQLMALIPNSIHNPVSSEELRRRTTLLNQKRLEYYDCFLFSLVVQKEHDARAKLYATQDSNLKKWIWEEIWDNIVDFGAFGHFYNLEKSFIDYDINGAEFPAEEKAV